MVSKTLLSSVFSHKLHCFDPKQRVFRSKDWAIVVTAEFVTVVLHDISTVRFESPPSFNTKFAVYHQESCFLFSGDGSVMKIGRDTRGLVVPSAAGSECMGYCLCDNVVLSCFKDGSFKNFNLDDEVYQPLTTGSTKREALDWLFSSDRFLVSAGRSGYLCLRQLDSMEFVDGMQIDVSHSIRNVWYLSHRSLLIVAHANDMLSIFSASTGKISSIKQLKLSSQIAQFLQIGKLVYAAFANGEVLSFCLSSLNFTSSSRLSLNIIDTVPFDQYVLVFDDLLSIHIYDTEFSDTGKIIPAYQEISDACLCGDKIAIATASSFVASHTIDSESKPSLVAQKLCGKGASFITLNAIGPYLFAGSSDGVLALFYNCQFVNSLHFDGQIVTYIDSREALNAHQVVLSFDDGHVSLLSLNASHQLASRWTVKISKKELTSVRFSSSGTDIFATSQDKLVYLVSASNGAVRLSMKGHSKTVWSLAFLDRYMVSASSDMKLILWDLHSNSSIYVVQGHMFPLVYLATFHRHIVSLDSAGSVKLWRISSSKLIEASRFSPAAEQTISSIINHNNGILLVYSDSTTQFLTVSDEASITKVDAAKSAYYNKLELFCKTQDFAQALRLCINNDSPFFLMLVASRILKESGVEHLNNILSTHSLHKDFARLVFPNCNLKTLPYFSPLYLDGYNASSGIHYKTLKKICERLRTICFTLQGSHCIFNKI